ncbi:MAG: 16S rRNA (cytidine(1402)-2'-O)-methyltransferase, partial [Solirubrobacterales bacterium]|nr:16S rRNA (cytidine(1402)-2'-O)-methyltransferase [Solirubrobacterales bacterium]
MSGRLIICPTPIGNLEDVTLRVLAALREADVVACEDTRRTRVLLDRYGVRARLVSYHEHNERERARELVGLMRGGSVVALVSDAGTPLVSDPGFVLVQ